MHKRQPQWGVQHHLHSQEPLLVFLFLQVLSANAESPINIECLMDDVDVRSELNRDQLEEMIQPFLGRLNTVLRASVESSGMLLSHTTALPISLQTAYQWPQHSSIFNFPVVFSLLETNNHCCSLLPSPNGHQQ